MKQKYIEMLGLSKQFTKEELLQAFITRIFKLSDDDNKSEIYILNEAYHYLIPSCKKNLKDNMNSKNNIYTESICERIGMSLNEALLVFKKIEKKDKTKSFDEYVSSSNKLYKKLSERKEDYISIISKCKELSLVPYDRLFNMYNNDLELNVKDGYSISFESYLYTMSSLLNSASKLGGISLEDEYKEFAESDCIFFLEYIVDKVSIKYYLNKLGKEEYVERYNYEYKNNSSVVSFAEYLRKLHSVQVLREEVRMSEEELDECFESYKKLGYGSTKLDFLKEYSSIREYCSFLPSMYFALKSSYNSLKDNNRPDSFVNYVRLEQARVETGFSYSKMIEIMFEHAIKNGYSGTIEDYVYGMVGYSDEDESDKKLILK